MELGGGRGGTRYKGGLGNVMTNPWAPGIPKCNTRMEKQPPPPLSWMKVLTWKVTI